MIRRKDHTAGRKRAAARKTSAKPKRQTRVNNSPRALISIPFHCTTYIVRRKGWSVLLEIAMGLEGYSQYPCSNFSVASAAAASASEHLERLVQGRQPLRVKNANSDALSRS
jgi:hypothetical protein